MDRYDVIVLGGGSAGTAAAAAARRAGAHTAMVNRDELGGLCILRGCMPTKAMLASSHAARLGDGIESLGAHLEGRVTVDFPKLMRRKQQLVERFKRAKIESIESNDYDVIFGHGRFLTDGTLDVDGRILAAERYVLATGSEPTVVPLPGIDEVPVWTSDDVMELTRQPESLVVFGAGAIGLELAQFFAEIGTRVLVVNRSPLLRRYDLEAGRELRAALGKLDELHFAIPGTIERLRREGDGLIAQVSTDDGSMEWTADALVMAAGRRPMIDGLGLDEVGVVVKDGRIRHDATMQTDNPRIYVAGDVTGELQILHLANDEGATAGHNAAGA
ncbi:MAG: FAD-dependent oxidoreductase, partial [Acidobacteriota bacterium]|nr:FAD-dependent oxidoreductase [Acidobacteriota bacterium]